MSLLYYSRMRFIQNLTRLLLAGPQIAHVISIFAGNIEDSIKSGPPHRHTASRGLRNDERTQERYLHEDLFL